MPTTFCQLAEHAVLSATSISSGLHNLLLPAHMAANSMGGEGMGQLYSWVTQHGSLPLEKREMQWEMLKLAKQLARLLTHAEAGLPQWCRAAAELLHFQAAAEVTAAGGRGGGGAPGPGAAAAGEELAILDVQLQQGTAQHLFWLLLVMAVNNRPPANAGSWSCAVQIQQVGFRVGGSIP
jgi:hypothetical protein